jgi:hypothetical protein
VQASNRSGSTLRLQLVVSSLAPQAKPVASSRVTKVRRFLRFAGTMAAQGRNKGFNTRQSSCRQQNSTTSTPAFQLATRSETFALVKKFHLAKSPPAAAASHRFGCTKRNPIFAPAKVRPNPSLKLTRYGRRCKPVSRHTVHHREPGLQRLPPRAA